MQAPEAPASSAPAVWTLADPLVQPGRNHAGQPWGQSGHSAALHPRGPDAGRVHVETLVAATLLRRRLTALARLSFGRAGCA